MIAAALAAEGERALAAAGIEAPRREARLLLALALGVEAQALVLDDPRVDDAAAERFRALLARRAAHEPFAHLAGRRGFWTHDLEVTPATLIPRPETEILVETALALAGDRRAPLEILDLGTGSGAILIALLGELPNATGFGVDVSEGALEVARRNALRAGVGARARFGVSSWWSHVRGDFDLVVSNPPYIPSGDIAGLARDVRDYEPRLALDGGPDGLAAYRAIAAGAAGHLLEGAGVAVEIGHDQAADVSAVFAEAGFRRIAACRDLGGRDRALMFAPEPDSANKRLGNSGK